MLGQLLSRILNHLGGRIGRMCGMTADCPLPSKHKPIASPGGLARVRSHASGPDGVFLLAPISCHLGLRGLLNLDGYRCGAPPRMALGAVHPGSSGPRSILLFLLYVSRTALACPRSRIAPR